MTEKKITSLESERERRGLPVERWRNGIYALLRTARNQVGTLARFRKVKKRPER